MLGNFFPGIEEANLNDPQGKRCPNEWLHSDQTNSLPLNGAWETIFPFGFQPIFEVFAVRFGGG